MSFYDAVVNSKNPPSALKTALTELVTERRFPLSALLELSPVCNFKCPFCYARRTPEELEKSGEKILRFSDWKQIIDGIAELGTYKLTLSGGECMLHPDFTEIYRYAYERGFQITLMTNGSCVSPSILELFKKYPPNRLYITLYGASPETYAAVCGDANYFDRVIRNIEALVDARVELVLQFTAGKDNVFDLKGVYEISQKYHTQFRYAKADIAYRRTSIEMLSECEASWMDYDQAVSSLQMFERSLTEAQYRDYMQQPVEFVELPVTEKGMPCSAGVSSFCVNYLGLMLPCVHFSAFSISTREHTMAECWAYIVSACNEVPRLTECTNCLHRAHCKACLATHYDDIHEFGRPSPRLCYKQLFPENAAEVEERYAREGHLIRQDLC